LLSLITLTVIVDPSFLALTTTPSIGPSSCEVTCPTSAAGPSGSAAADTILGAELNAPKTRQPVAIRTRIRVRMVPSLKEIC
jgi:hypothetical protein